MTRPATTTASERDGQHLGLAFVRALAVGLLLFAAAVPETARADDAEAPLSAAVFDFEFVNWSQETDYGADNSVEIERLDLISDLLRQLLTESGRYALKDTAPAAARVAAVNSLHGCNGCDADIARDLGAALAITGVVNKVSNMELALVIRIRNAKTKKVVIAYQADIRGNTDKSWTRGVSWLVRNRILNPKYAFKVE